MISERDFAKSFQSFWAELLPLLTPNFTHIINESYKERLVDDDGQYISPISVSSEMRHSALVAEFAFFLAKAAHLNNMKISKIIKYPQKIKEVELTTIQRLSRVEASFTIADKNLSLNQDELAEGIKLAKNYEIFLLIFDESSEVEFSPKISGSGFLSNCEGDISIGSTLFEVKTVNRNLAGKDIRQLITYLALQASTSKRRWNKAGFLNPRKTVYHIFDIDDLIYQISGGKAATEIFGEIIDFVTSREIQIDSQF